MQLKIYQENAIDDLLAKTKRLLGYSGIKKLVFKSPDQKLMDCINIFKPRAKKTKNVLAE